MTNSKQNKNRKNINSSIKSYLISKDFFSILPLIILVFFIPFVIRLEIIELHGSLYDYWTGENLNTDFFSYYKKIFLYIITIWISLSTYFFTDKIKNTKANYFLGFFGLLVILSTLFSNYPLIARHGFVERYEGMWVVICYLIIIFSSINLIKTEKQIKALVYSLGVSGFIISVISIFQYFGMDIFQANWFKYFIVSSEKMAMLEDFTFKFGEGHSYGVFYNPNYLGGYLSFYIPLVLGYTIIESKNKEKVLFSVFAFFATLALFFSKSEAGLLGTILSSTVMLLLVWIYNLKRSKTREEYQKLIIKKVIPLTVIILISPLAASYIDIQRNPLQRIREELFELITPNREVLKYREIGPLNDIYISDNKATVKISGKELKIYSDGDNIIIDNFKDETIHKSKIPETIERKSIGNGIYGELELTVYPGNSPSIAGVELHFIESGNTRLYFGVIENETVITSVTFKVIEVNEARYFGFKGKGSLGSGRGYIWSRSFPLLIDNFFIGSGQDTFVTEFPQYDLYARQVEYGRGYRYMWQIIDKPHSLYLQVGIHSGFISLLVFVIGLSIMTIKGIINYLKKNEKMSLIITSGLVGWLVSSLFNDSIIGITPIIMVFIGILIRKISDFKSSTDKLEKTR